AETVRHRQVVVLIEVILAGIESGKRTEVDHAVEDVFLLKRHSSVQLSFVRPVVICAGYGLISILRLSSSHIGRYRKTYLTKSGESRTQCREGIGGWIKSQTCRNGAHAVNGTVDRRGQRKCFEEGLSSRVRRRQ